MSEPNPLDEYLWAIAKQAIVSEEERIKIDVSIKALETRLSEYFDKSVIAQKIPFGSHQRNTMLPRCMDEYSDVDYMVVFSDRDKTPEAYLSRLKGFIKNKYPRSIVYQDHPTVALDMHHIRVELVPAINSLWDGLNIPSKGSVFKWIATDPNDLHRKIDAHDDAHNGLIRPLIRLVKYWNSLNGYPFESYFLEKKILSRNFFFSRKTLPNYFIDFMNDIDVEYDASQKRKKRINLLKERMAAIRDATYRKDGKLLVRKLKVLLPPTEQIALQVW